MTKKAEAAIKEFKAAANNPDTFKKTPGDSGICQQMISDANAYGDEICTEDVVTDKESTTTPSTGSSSGSSDEAVAQAMIQVVTKHQVVKPEQRHSRQKM